MTRNVDHYINGKRVAGTSGRTADVTDPSRGEIVAKVALATGDETRAAIAAAEAAFPA